MPAAWAEWVNRWAADLDRDTGCFWWHAARTWKQFKATIEYLRQYGPTSPAGRAAGLG